MFFVFADALFSLISARVNLNHVFKKREVVAAAGLGLETQRSKKARVEEAPSEGRVPSFLAKKPVLIEEDPSPFEVGWGLRNMETSIGDSKAAAEWSRSVVTPRDRAHVVESSDDLQIELLGGSGYCFCEFLDFLFQVLLRLFVYFTHIVWSIFRPILICRQLFTTSAGSARS